MGAPKTIQSDLGSAFVSKLFQELCSLYDIEHCTAASQNHESVSRAEVTHRILLSTLRKVYAQNPNWCEWLPVVQLSLLSSVVTTTGLTPAFMVFHREIRVPHLPYPSQVSEFRDKSILDLVETTRLTDELIYENTQISFAKADKFHNKSAQERVFTVGDTALMYSENIPVGTLRKLHCFYRPVEIIQCLPNSCYRVKDNTSGRILPFKIHVTRLKIKPSEDNTSAEDRCEATPPQAKQQDTPTKLATPTMDAQQQQQMPQPTNPTSPAWHAITGIQRRRRTPSGAYEYLVEWQADKSTNWLRARDITPELVRDYNLRMRRRRRH